MLLLSQLDDGFTLFHDPSHNWLYATWTGQRSAAQMQHDYDLILQHARSSGCIKLLNDSTEDQDGWSSLTTWLAKKRFPELAGNGIQAVAWVLPTDALALYDTRKVIHLIKEPLIDVFADVESAHEWLLQWPKQDSYGAQHIASTTSHTEN